jgi:hypothetical protein
MAEIGAYGKKQAAKRRIIFKGGKIFSQSFLRTPSGVSAMESFLFITVSYILALLASNLLY